MKKFIILFTLFFSVRTYAVTDPSILHGEKLFQNYCSACHSLKYLSPAKKKIPTFFGVTPPDLSLEVNIRGTHWIEAYLNGFYADPQRPSGSNNIIYPDTAMPNILVGLKNQLSEKEFQATIHDIVNFLAYASDPHQAESKALGYWVIGFLIIFAIVISTLMVKSKSTA